MKILFVDAPAHFESLFEIPIGHQLVTFKTVPDIVNLFVRNHSAFVKGMQRLLPFYRENREMIIWVSWYKKTSGIATDLTEDRIRNFALEHDLVDIKVCAIDQQWSGLKLVMRVSRR